MNGRFVIKPATRLWLPISTSIGMPAVTPSFHNHVTPESMRILWVALSPGVGYSDFLPRVVANDRGAAR